MKGFTSMQFSVQDIHHKCLLKFHQLIYRYVCKSSVCFTTMISLTMSIECRDIFGNSQLLNLLKKSIC